MAYQVQAYNQGRDPRWYAGEVKPERIGVGASSPDHYEPTETSRGVCFGLSIWWIIKSAQGQDFWSWMPGPGPQVADIKELFLSQNGPHDFIRFESADLKIRGDTGMVRQNEILMETGTNWIHDGYYYISLRGLPGDEPGKESGHAIAALLNKTGTCRYFDPNFGEYAAHSVQDMLQGLSQLVREHYFNRDLNIFWCCWNKVEV